MRILFVFFSLLSILGAEITENKTFAEYKIKPGDVLNIIITPTEDLSKEVTVQKDGKINIKLIGDITAGGFTLKELSEKIEKELSKYVTKPVVSVTLKEIGKSIIYVMGQAATPGSYDYKDNLKILELLSLAGGFTNSADLASVKVFRGSGDKKDVITVNMEDVINKGEMQKDIELKANDIVYIPQKGITGWNWFLNDVLPSIYLVTTIVSLYFLVKK